MIKLELEILPRTGTYRRVGGKRGTEWYFPYHDTVNTIHLSGEWSPFRHAKYMWKKGTVAAKKAEAIRKEEEEESIRNEEAKVTQLAKKKSDVKEERAKVGEARRKKIRLKSKVNRVIRLKSGLEHKRI
ncbi:hypothetical protein BU26DRAFT_176883 [Trematosphaeria pertusa]|uniref:Uncharacterized protein n=1 Tax=Trematosphaeria pertusa TaxID=390896 RepID=A0A6A6HVA6_9PLEO|nr:uncharacterized protein BU26DRAFT_176883 [Trematosphaeria pertusa]KAF2241360.1 hypothetical protein BU26DRAFT_176883 [Trematosphaeria pertusa]